MMTPTEKAQAWIDENALILDTETTGLGGNAEIVEISIIDCTGAVLMDTLIKPTRPIPADATRIHGIANEMVASAPTWPMIVDQFKAIVSGRKLIIYSADYDLRIIYQTNSKHELDPVFYGGEWSNAECAMLAYAAFYGEWDNYREQYKWQRLGNAARQQGVVIEGKAHRALADCQMTLGVIKAMAEGGKK